jgi:hypothetical protein
MLQMPVSLQAMQHGPIAVANSAKLECFIGFDPIMVSFVPDLENPAPDIRLSATPCDPISCSTNKKTGGRCRAHPCYVRMLPEGVSSDYSCPLSASFSLS